MLLITGFMYRRLCDVKPYDKQTARETLRAHFATLCKGMLGDEIQYVVLYLTC
jgi:hypothetical protein